MKARVKGTTDIIEVVFDKDVLNACYPPYYDKEHDMYYQPEQLEWVDNDANAEPDYWTRLEHQAAIAAMQAQMAPNCLDSPEGVACTAYAYAHALVEKMKEEKE